MVMVEVSKPDWLGFRAEPCWLVGTNDGVDSLHNSESSGISRKKEVKHSFLSTGKLFPAQDGKAVFIVGEPEC